MFSWSVIMIQQGILISKQIIYNWLNTSIMFKQTRTDYFHVLHKLRTDIAYLVGTSGFCQMHFFKEGI